MRASHHRQNHARHYLGLIVTLVGLISAVTMLLGPSKRASAQAVVPSWRYTGTLNTARTYHTATQLLDGKVLVVGGQDQGNLSPPVALNSAELYEPATGTWTSAGNLHKARRSHTMTLLPNGKVLVAGGYANNVVLSSAELYDPATGMWSVTGSLNSARNLHTATLLPNGKVLVAGGSDGNTLLSSAELYDPATETWSLTGHLNTARYIHTATLLPNSKVLVAGGVGGDKTAELYDPASESWSSTGSLTTGRYYHTATLLPDGKVLVAGNVLICGSFVCLDTVPAELYNPTTGTWSETADPGVYNNEATLLPNGKVLLIPEGTGFAELYDPASGTFSLTVNPIARRYGCTTTLLFDGKVLVAAGGVYGGSSAILNTAELYDAGNNQIDDAQFFVLQHYQDFLNRQPDAGGLTYWTERISGNSRNDPPACATGDGRCLNERRIGVSAAFFVELEFQDTGYFVYRFYKASFGHQPNYSEFTSDRGKVAGGPNLEASKQAFADEWVQRPAFVAAYPITLSNTELVNKIFDSAGLTGSVYDPQRQQEIAAMNAGGGRAQVLRDVIEIPDFKDIPDPNNPRYGELKRSSQYNPAFVLMQYFGYLHRDLDQGGYDFWLDVVNNREPNNYHGMVCSFITSSEYQLRFGSVITHSNADCGP